MPQTVNGIGTSVCPARGFTKPQGSNSANYDAVICVVVFYMPIIPLRAVHTHSWRGTGYVECPIRWSPDLVFWAFARRYALLAAVVGIFMGFAAVTGTSGHGMQWGLIGGTAAVCTLGFGLIYAFGQADARHRAIRALIGTHRLGSSDPAHWTEDILKNVAVSMELFGTPTDTAAVPGLIEKKDFGMAMYAARLAVAREDRGAGEALTDKILHDPGARAVIDQAPKVSFWSSM